MEENNIYVETPCFGLHIKISDVIIMAYFSYFQVSSERLSGWRMTKVCWKRDALHAAHIHMAVLIYMAYMIQNPVFYFCYLEYLIKLTAAGQCRIVG